jgi:hypothetical protein
MYISQIVKLCVREKNKKKPISTYNLFLAEILKFFIGTCAVCGTINDISSLCGDVRDFYGFS